MTNDEYLTMMGDTIAITIGSYFRTLKEHMPEEEAREFLADFLYLIANAMSGQNVSESHQPNEESTDDLFGLKIPKVGQ